LCASLCLGASDKKRYPHRGICMRDHAYKGVNGVRFVIAITILIFLSAIMSTDASLRAYPTRAKPSTSAESEYYSFHTIPSAITFPPSFADGGEELPIGFLSSAG
jgi:hypothetical protein